MANFKFNNLAAYLLRNPIPAVASVFAPFLASGDDRGYFKTALLTTPLVFGAAELFPKVFSSVGKHAPEFKDLLQKSENWTRFESQSYSDVKSIYQNIGSKINEADQALSAYLVGSRRSRDLVREQKVINRYFKDRFVKTNDLIGKAKDMSNPGAQIQAAARVAEIEQLQANKGRMISNALHSARRSSLSPSEWSKEGSSPFPSLDNEGMLAMFEKYESRPEFVQNLKRSLRTIKDAEYSNKSIHPGQFAEPISEFSSILETSSDMFNNIDKSFASAKPELLKSLATAKERGFIRDAQVIAEKTTSGEIGRLLNVRVFRKGNIKPLEIPIVDSVGSVRLGPNMTGVGTHVIGPDANPYTIDTWIGKVLSEHPEFTNEQLEQEIASHAYYMAGEPMDAHRLFELGGSGGSPMMNEMAIRARAYTAKGTTLPMFSSARKSGMMGIRDLDPAEQALFLKKMLNTGQYVNMGPEAGTYEFRLQLKQLADINLTGLSSATKQDAIYRSISKEFSLRANEPESSGIINTAWQDILGSKDLPMARPTLAGISPQDKSIFGDLPRTAEEFSNYKPTLYNQLTARMSPDKANQMIGEVEGIYAQGKQGIFANLGGMGETEFMLDPAWASKYHVESDFKYEVNELAMEKGSVNPNSVLGFNNGSAVTPDFIGDITSVSKNQDGKGFFINVKHKLDLQGAKVDINGIKGLSKTVGSPEDFRSTVGLLNSFYEKTGSGDRILDDAVGLVDMRYFQNKMDPGMASIGMAEDVLSRLRNKGRLDIADKWRSKMAPLGLSYDEQAGAIIIKQQQGERIARFQELININEEFFQEAGRAVKEAGGLHDQVLQHLGEQGSNFLLRNNLKSTMFAWDHALAYIPRNTSINYDIETYLRSTNNVGALKALRSRMKTVSGGSPEDMINFGKYLMEGDFNKEYGTTVPLNKAFNKGPLNSAEGRAGTIFDPSIDAYKAGVRLDLGEGGKYKYLPVPGNNAYGSEAMMYGPGEYQSRPWQDAIQDISKAKTAGERDTQVERVLNMYKEGWSDKAGNTHNLFVGKASALRPNQYDPMGISGYLTTRSNAANIFEIGISPEAASRIRSSTVRKLLEKDKEVFGMFLRQPTNEAFHVKVRVDEALKGTQFFGVDEELYRSMYGDADKDLVSLLLWEGSDKDAIAEAKSAIYGGSQAQRVGLWQQYKGDQEVSRNVTEELKTVGARAAKFAEEAADRTGIALKRTAGASIGTFSNVLTKLGESAIRNPFVMKDPDLATRLRVSLFDSIRQAPISARKSTVPFDLETAIKLSKQLEEQWGIENPEEAATGLGDVLMNMAEFLTEGKKEGPEYRYLAGQGREDLLALTKGRNEYGKFAARALSISGSGSRAKESMGEAVADVFTDVDAIRGPAHGGGMSEVSASRIGEFSSRLSDLATGVSREFSSSVREVVSQHGGKIALGLGALAVAGILTTRRESAVPSFTRASSNQYRPESMMGVTDHETGEAVAGQMAPTNPPRRRGVSPGGVTTAVMAPLGQTSDITVEMRATDRSRAAETARQLSEIPGARFTSTTINYKDRNRLGSLRGREKIRETLNG